MFRLKKRPQATPPGRHRPSPRTERQNAAVFSYHANRSATNAPDGGRSAPVQPGAAADRREQVGRPARLAHAMRILLVGLALTMGLLNMLLSTRPRLITVADAPSTSRPDLFLHSTAEYTAAASDILERSPLNRTKITINTKKVASTMRDQFPELGGVRVSVPIIGQQPVITLEPARPALLLTSSEGDVYVVDTAGKALATFMQTPHTITRTLPTVRDQSGLAVKVGGSALPSTDVAFITEVIGQLKAKHLVVSSLTLPRNTSELDLQISGAPYIVKYNLHGNARAEAGTFLAVKQHLDGSGVIPSSYIDVRVETRAYYK